jgi:hypothetical protein
MTHRHHDGLPGGGDTIRPAGALAAAGQATVAAMSVSTKATTMMATRA